MIEADEKSTAAGNPAPPSGLAEVGAGAWLDSRLALVHPEEGWLAASDLHHGYEVNRRAAGGLFPLWGRRALEERFFAVLDDHAPRTVVLVGDVVDSGRGGAEALAWLERVRDRCQRLVLVEGNHDRGVIREAAEFVESHSEGRFFFHHGHADPAVPPEARVEVTGHWHPALDWSDGAGLRLRVPCLVQEAAAGGGPERWILPAFSPWAGGGRWRAGEGAAESRLWACAAGRVFQWMPG